MKIAMFANRTTTQPQGWVVVASGSSQHQADTCNYRFSFQSEAKRAAAEDNYEALAALAKATEGDK